MKIYIVIPAYNEAKRINHVLEDLKSQKLPIIVVDDGSYDNTYEIIKNYPVTSLRHKINLGKGAALKTGIEAAFSMGADAIIMMDSDGQHLISDLPKFVDELNNGNADIIFGSRNLKLGMPTIRFLGNKFASGFIGILFDVYISDLTSGFRAFTKKAYKKIIWQSSGYSIETEMVIRTGKAGLKFTEIPIETVYLDNFKGVTILDAISTLFLVLKWKFVR